MLAPFVEAADNSRINWKRVLYICRRKHLSISLFIVVLSAYVFYILAVQFLAIRVCRISPEKSLFWSGRASEGDIHANSVALRCSLLL